jgi:hypothetical protein
VSTQHEEACPDIGPICDVRAEPPQVHDQSITLGELQLSGAYTFDETWSINAVLPLRVVRTRIVFRDLSGRPLDLDYAHIHHRDATLIGLADALVGTRAKTTLFGVTFYGEIGLSLPLADTEADPFLAAEEGREHEHLQFGTGTYRPVFGTGASLALGPLGLAVWGITVLSLYENSERYEAGDRFAAGLVLSTDFGALNVRAGGETQIERAERWRGEIPASDGNRGRTDLLVTLGTSYAISQSWSARLDLKIPVYTHVDNGQLDYPALLDIGIARSFAF